MSVFTKGNHRLYKKALKRTICWARFPYNCAGHQSTLPFSIRIPQILSFILYFEKSRCVSSVLRTKPLYLAGTFVTIELTLRGGPSDQLFELPIIAKWALDYTNISQINKLSGILKKGDIW
jgi:hypothetical protein